MMIIILSLITFEARMLTSKRMIQKLVSFTIQKNLILFNDETMVNPVLLENLKVVGKKLFVKS